MATLLDTSALLSHFRGELGVDRVQALFEDDGAEIWLASVSLPEFGRRLRDLGLSESEVRRVIADYLDVVTGVVPVDADVALAALELVGRGKARIPLIDGLIAAAARSQKAQLVHRDAHFHSLPAGWVSVLDLGSPGA